MNNKQTQRRISRVSIPKSEVPDSMALRDYFMQEDRDIFPPRVLARIASALTYEPFSTVGDLRRASDRDLRILPSFGPLMLHCLRERLGYATEDAREQDKPRQEIALETEVERLRGEVKALKDVIAMLIAIRPDASADPARPPPALEPPASDDDTPRR